MRAAVFHAPYRLFVEELPSPTAGPADVVVAVEACGVCGSDIASFTLGHYVDPGQVLGHEFCGRVMEVGRAVVGVTVNDRVIVRPMRSCGECPYCREGQTHLCGSTNGRSLGYGAQGGYAERVLIADAIVDQDVYVIPEHVDPLDALWGEPLAVAVHAVGLTRPEPGASLVVIGGGSVGLCVAAAARASGYADVTVVEPRDVRREAAQLLGMRTSDGANQDVYHDAARVVDASGSAHAIGLAMEAMRPGGRLVLIGLGDAPVPWLGGRVEVVGSFAYTDADFARSVDLIASGSVSLRPLVTHPLDLRYATLAVTASLNEPTVVKAALIPSPAPTLEGTS